MPVKKTTVRLHPGSARVSHEQSPEIPKDGELLIGKRFDCASSRSSGQRKTCGARGGVGGQRRKRLAYVSDCAPICSMTRRTSASVTMPAPCSCRSSSGVKISRTLVASA